MTNTPKKAAALLLALLMLVPAVSCAEGTAEETSADTSTSVQNPESTEETVDDSGVTQYAPDLPERDYEGYEMRIITRDDSMHPYPSHTRDILAEQLTGESFNDTVFERNLLIEDNYGIRVVMEAHSETVSEATPQTLVSNSVRAGSDDYDLLFGHMINIANLATSKVLLNWNLLPLIDFDKPYWNKSAVDAFSVGEKTYCALSDMCVSSNDNAHVMVYNKELAAAVSAPNFYELVYENEWTYDKFTEVIKNVTADLDGNGEYEKSDRYGYLCAGGSSLINFMYAAGNMLVSKDENNYPVASYYTERNINSYDWLRALLKNTDTFYDSTSWVKPECIAMFLEDRAMIMSTQIMMFEHLRSMESDFGVLPFPKYDSEQENYGHYVDGHATIMAIPKTVSDHERTAIFLEAMAYESYRTLLPVYYDVLLTTKYMRDQDSRNMLDIVYNTRVFDFGYAYMYSNLGTSYSSKAPNDEDITSFYKSLEKVVNKQIQLMAKAFDKDE